MQNAKLFTKGFLACFISYVEFHTSSTFRPNSAKYGCLLFIIPQHYDEYSTSAINTPLHHKRKNNFTYGSIGSDAFPNFPSNWAAASPVRLLISTEAPTIDRSKRGRARCAVFLFLLRVNANRAPRGIRSKEGKEFACTEEWAFERRNIFRREEAD